MSIHSDALNKIVVGQRYRVMRKAKDFESGWKNIWAPEMDCRIDAIGTVSGTSAMGSIQFRDFGFGFPAHVLMPEFSISGYFKLGQRVRVARESGNYEHGWDAIWDSSMDVGDEGVIVDIDRKSGCLINGYWYPEWCLEHAPVEKAKIEFQVGDIGPFRNKGTYEILSIDPTERQPIKARMRYEADGKQKETIGRFYLDGRFTDNDVGAWDLMPPTSRGAFKINVGGALEAASKKSKELRKAQDTYKRYADDAYARTYGIHTAMDEDIAEYSEALRAYQERLYYNPPTKDTAMKNPKIETITFVDGERVDNLSQDSIFNMIAGLEAEIERLGKIASKPKALEARIAQLGKTIVDLVVLSDNKAA